MFGFGGGNQVRVTVVGDASQLKREMASARGDVDQFAGKTEGRMTRMGSVVKGALVAGAGAAVVSFAKSSIDAFSNLNESVNAVEVVFGEAADGILEIGESSVESFGMSQRAFNEFSVRFSAFAQQIAEQDGRSVVDVVDEMSTRVADFASVHNLSLERAAEVAQSTMAGETEVFRRFGGDVSAATVQAHAFETGIAEVGSELTEQQKILSRYSLFMEQTEDTAGDFKNTSDELAGSQRILSARWEEAQAKLGGLIAGPFATLLDVGIDVINFFEELAEVVDAANTTLTESEDPFTKILAAVIGLENPTIALREELEAEREAMEAAGDAANSSAAEFEVQTGATGRATEALYAQRDAAMLARPEIETLAGKTRDLKDEVDEFADVLEESTDAMLGDVESFLTGFSKLPDETEADLDQFIQNFQDRTSFLTDWYSNLEALARAGNTALVDELKREGPEAASGYAEAFANDLASAENANRVIAAGESMATSAGADFVGQQVISQWEAAGGSLAEGVAEGIRSRSHLISSAAVTAVNAALLNAQKAAGISSPSRVWAEEVGIPIPEGIAEGVREAAHEAEVSVEEMMDDMLSAAMDGAGDIMGAIRSEMRLGDAVSDVESAQAALDTLIGRQDDMPALIKQAQERLAKARAEARRVTPAEQVDIERAQEALTRARESGSAAEVALAEQRLREARRDSTGPTREVTQAEEDLADLREESVGLPDEIREAERKLIDQRLDLIDANTRLVDSVEGLHDLAPGSWEFFTEMARQAGVPLSIINELSEAVRSLRTEGMSVDEQIVSSGDRNAIASRINAIYRNRDHMLPKAGTLNRLVDEVLAGRTLDSIRASVENFDSGGVVGGPFGAPRLAVVHGGEEVLTAAQRNGGMGDGDLVIVADLNGFQAEIGRIAKRELVMDRKRNGTNGV